MAQTHLECGAPAPLFRRQPSPQFITSPNDNVGAQHAAPHVRTISTPRPPESKIACGIILLVENSAPTLHPYCSSFQSKPVVILSEMKDLGRKRRLERAVAAAVFRNDYW